MADVKVKFLAIVCKLKVVWTMWFNFRPNTLVVAFAVIAWPTRCYNVFPRGLATVTDRQYMI